MPVLPAEPVMPTTMASRSASPRRPAEPAERAERVVDPHDRGDGHVGGRASSRHQRDAAPRANGVGDEVVTVALGDERDEARARLERRASRW